MLNCREAQLAEFKSLTARLGDHWTKPLAKLPKGLAKEVEQAFTPFTWDSIGPTARASLASQIDYNNDPAMEAHRTAVWEQSVLVNDLEIEKETIERLSALVPTEYQAKRTLIAQHKAEHKAALELLEQIIEDVNRSEDATVLNPAAPSASEEFKKHQSKAAKMRHRENHQMQDDTIKHYKAHKNEYKNMTDAATKIAGKIVPMPMRTVYGWIRDWEKIQSAG